MTAPVVQTAGIPTIELANAGNFVDVAGDECQGIDFLALNRNPGYQYGVSPSHPWQLSSDAAVV